MKNFCFPLFIALQRNCICLRTQMFAHQSSLASAIEVDEAGLDSGSQIGIKLAIANDPCRNRQF